MIGLAGSPCILKIQAQCKLHIARAAATQEGISCADIWCGRQGQKPFSLAARPNNIEAVLEKINTEVGPQWIGKIRMIQQIEYINPDLHLQPFCQLVVFDQAKVKVLVVRSHKSIAAQIAKVLVPDAIPKAIYSTRYLERAKVQELTRPLGPGKRIAHKIGTPKKLTAAIEVPFKQVIHVKGLAGRYGEHAIHGPSRA